MGKWTYELNKNSDIWFGGLFNTKEEMLEEANKEAIEYGLESFRIGNTQAVPNFGIDAEQVIDDIRNTMYDNVGEASEDYLYYVPSEHLEELEEGLNEVFYKWQEKYGYKPDFYTIVNEEEVKTKKK